MSRFCNKVNGETGDRRQTGFNRGNEGGPEPQKEKIPDERRGVPLYMPDDLEDDKLFDTGIQVGQNFERYSSMTVQCDMPKNHGNRATERNFGPPPTEKMIRQWRKQEEELKKANKQKHNLRTVPSKWPDLEENLKTWILDQRNLGLAVTTKMIILEARRTENTKRLAKGLNIQLAVIPGGLTSQLQPLDVGFIKPFKNNMREQWNKWMTEGNHDMTPTVRMKRPSIPEVCEWVLKSWCDIKTKVIVKSFKKCGISNAMDGTEDNLLYETDSSDDDDDISSRDDSELGDESNSDDFSGFEDE
ncbi:Pogo transposable element-like 37 [Homarus americanus]|uniref:Pogo transposable element-like 37 n=1 Tax=Homarus americanus TaxID=6706 RepID=A0A8J5JRW9_HOMAM|nr:Pogo transposable element-like 37 [Homarus americanus]